MNRVGNFSTRDTEAGDRIKAFEDTLGKVMTGLTVTSPTKKALNVELNWQKLASMRFINLEMGPVTFTRSGTDLRDGDDGFSLITCLGGSFRVAGPDGAIIPIVAGMAALTSHQLASTSMADDHMSAATLVLSRDLVNEVLHSPELVVQAPPQGGIAAMSLLSSYTRSLASMKKPLSPHLAHIAEGHILDLLANAYDPLGEWARARPNEGVNDARCQQILELIASSYADPRGSAETFGTQLGIGTRSVHKILEKTGLSFSEHLLETRLQAAHVLLQDQNSSHMRVIDIALAVGFSDISYFNRTFRRRFGETPSSIR